MTFPAAPQLPDRFPDYDSTADPRTLIVQLGEQVRDLMEYLRNSPRWEIREVKFRGNFPLTISTSIRRPIGVAIVKAYDPVDPSASTSVTSPPSWQASAGQVIINAVAGMSPATELTLHVLIFELPTE